MGSKFTSKHPEHLARVEISTQEGHPIAGATVPHEDGIRTAVTEGIFEANRSGKPVEIRADAIRRNPDGTTVEVGVMDTGTCYPKSDKGPGFCQPTKGGPKPR